MKAEKTIRCPKCKGCGVVENQKYIGQLAQKRREKAMVTLRELYDVTGYSISYWSDLEHGRKAWNSNLLKLNKDAIRQIVETRNEHLTNAELALGKDDE